MHHSPRTGLLRSAAAVLATLVLVPVLATPAHAGRDVVDDGSDDMWVVEEGGTEPLPAPGTEVGDFVRTVFKHSGTRVTVKSEFAELQPSGKRTRLWVAMRDQDKKKTWALVETTRRDRNGSARLFTNRGKDIDCRLRYFVDFAEDTMSISFPRRCLGNPRFLTFKASSEHVAGGRRYAYVDNAHSKWATSRAWSDRVRRG